MVRQIMFLTHDLPRVAVPRGYGYGFAQIGRWPQHVAIIENE
jgi:hypothetical protein